MDTETAQYRWSRAVVLRPVGWLAVTLGLGWVVGAAIAQEVGSGLGMTATSLALGATAVALLAAALVTIRPPLAIEMSPEGYQLHHLRGGGVPAATWRDVESAATQFSPDGAVVVFQLADGGRSLLPLALFGPRSVEVEHEIHDRLNTAHGYRPLSS